MTVEDLLPETIADAPDSPVTVTLPRRVMKRVLDSVREHAYKLTRRDDQVGLRALSDASDVIGDAVGAPMNRRFRLPEKVYHAVIAGDEVEYDRWAERELPRRRIEDLGDDVETVFVDSVATALSAVYSGYTTTGTGYRRDDFQEVLAAVRSRVFRSQNR